MLRFGALRVAVHTHVISVCVLCVGVAAAATAHNTCSTDEQQDTEDAALSDEERTKLERSIARLKDRLERSSGRLTFTELRLAMLELEKVSTSSGFMAQIAKLEERLAEAEAELKKVRGDNLAMDKKAMEVAQLREDVGRRDEQIEFLMHVHEASAGYEWVTNKSAPPAAGKQAHAAGVGRPVGGAVGLLGLRDGGHSTAGAGAGEPGTSSPVVPSASALSPFQVPTQSAAVDTLMGLGLSVTRDMAAATLTAVGGDVDAAAQLLLSSGAGI